MFVETVLRHIGTAVGLPYEPLLKDFSKTNYSSARAALLEAWRFFRGRRHWLATNWASPVYELWLEEAIQTRVLAGLDPSRRLGRVGWEIGGEHVDPARGEQARQCLLARAEDQRLDAWPHQPGFRNGLQREAILPHLPVVDRRHLQSAAPMDEPGRFDVGFLAQLARQRHRPRLRRVGIEQRLDPCAVQLASDAAAVELESPGDRNVQASIACGRQQRDGWNTFLQCRDAWSESVSQTVKDGAGKPANVSPHPLIPIVVLLESSSKRFQIPDTRGRGKRHARPPAKQALR